jgi:hypothetical protein
LNAPKQPDATTNAYGWIETVTKGKPDPRYNALFDIYPVCYEAALIA